MVEGPTIMLGVFITLLYTHTMPNIYYCSTFMLLYSHVHLMAKLVWELAENRVDCFLIGGIWNLPTLGCKSMVEGLTIMLGVFITFLYTHTMPNIYYCSTYMLLCPHLMAKLVWEMAENQDFCKETCQHGAVKVWGGAYNHAGSVHHLVIHQYNVKHLLL